jgi:hypothetical protein
MTGHEQFEQLCALGAAGELTVDELSVLASHLETCSACREAWTEYTALLDAVLPLAMPAGTLPKASRISGWLRKQRFLKRARQQGLLAHGAQAGNRARTRAVLVAAACSACMICGFFAGKTAILKPVAEPVRSVTSTSPPSEMVAPSPAPPPPETARAEVRQSQADLQRIQRLEQVMRQMQESGNAYEHRIQTLTAEVTALQGQLEGAQAASARATELQIALDKTVKELDFVRKAGQQQHTLAAAQGVELADLRQRLALTREMLAQERELLAADRHIRDLMTSRSLHMIDVEDVNGSSNKTEFAGRIFYTEGKSLTFYAFDDGKRLNGSRGSILQAWGQAEGPATRARSLGIFNRDEVNQNRWVLRFEDPAVLAEIEQVFVTIEPPGGSDRPRGRKLMLASLDAVREGR